MIYLNLVESYPLAVTKIADSPDIEELNPKPHVEPKSYINWI